MMAQQRNYEDFSVDDFLNDEYFQEWLLKPDADNNRFWNHFINLHPEKRQAVETAANLLRGVAFKEQWPEGQKIESALQEALEKINSKKPTAIFRSMHRRWWVAAAAILLVVGGWWLAVERQRVERTPVAAAPKRNPQDIAPGGNKAVLTLADGTKVILDSANKGAITKQGNSTVLKLDDGRLAYDEKGATTTEVLYNAITTPKGGQYQVVLADGTRVWLNAASSLRFPTAFVGKERRVNLEGEGYFEVAHNAEKPFHVQVGGMDVQVLGTHFNVNAYSDEENVKTTLLEGRVKVSSGAGETQLNPGQQARLQATKHQLQTISNVDVEEVIAWKNGYFSFHNADLKTVMRQLSRWYDIDVEYKEGMPERVFEGEIQRDLMLSQALKLLEKNKVHFKTERKKIIVMP